MHVVASGSAPLRDVLDLREALTASPDLRRELTDLETALSARHRADRAAHGEGKSAFVARALAAWRSR